MKKKKTDLVLEIELVSKLDTNSNFKATFKMAMKNLNFSQINQRCETHSKRIDDKIYRLYIDSAKK